LVKSNAGVEAELAVISISNKISFVKTFRIKAV